MDPSSQAAQLVTVGVVERWEFIYQCFPFCTQAGVLSLGTMGFSFLLMLLLETNKRQ